ncbi:MAG TPA: hypothetical protein DHW64_12585, partial [Chitinophagaceae bacterium]|nr:hypothetical protein [Chitinophagaceae bacterium]
MRRLSYNKVKNEFERNYPVFIAFCSSTLALFSFFFQVQGYFPGVKAIPATIIVFVAAVATSWFVTKKIYRSIENRTANKYKTVYDIIESIDTCEFIDDNLEIARYQRQERVRINSKDLARITYKLPGVSSPGSIINVSCKINNNLVNYKYETSLGENLYCYYVNPVEFTDLTITWEFEMLNCFGEEDNIRVRSFQELEKCILRVLFNNSKKQIVAEAYKMYNNEDAAYSKEEVYSSSTNKQVLIEKDFS